MIRRTRGIILSFSGIDGAGKSTQILILENYLKGRNLKYKTIWTRGGYTYLFNVLKNLARRLVGVGVIPKGHNGRRDALFRRRYVKKIWMFVALLDLIIVYAAVLRVSRLINHVVLVDRYLGDTWVDFKVNFPDLDFEDWYLWKLLEKVTPDPEKSFLFIIPITECMKRVANKGDPYKQLDTELAIRHELYTELSRQPGWIICDSMKSVDETKKDIEGSVSGLLN